jgi:hypothetical protein
MDLWVVNADGTGLSAISGDGTNGFPHGAVWSPAGDSLIAAGTIYGTNGIWVIPLAADNSSCDCAEPLTPLPVSLGDPVDFVGSMLMAPSVPITNTTRLFIRSDPTEIVVFWSATYNTFTLQTTGELPAADAAWSGITGPYYLNGDYFEYHEPVTNLLAQQYFRLNQTGNLIVTPSQLMLVPRNHLGHRPKTGIILKQ